MSESSRLHKKDWKTIKDPQEEQKAKEVSKEESGSSSTPLETATETEGSDKMTLKKPSGEENVDISIKKLTIRDDDIISESKSGGGSSSSERALQDRAAINRRDHYPLDISRVGEFQRLAYYLFQTELTSSDFSSGRLSIPFQAAELHFPSTIHVSKYEYPIVISDTRNDIWYMKLTYNAQERTEFKFVIICGWEEFARVHRLNVMDMILFYRPVHSLQPKHYLIDSVKAKGNAPCSDSIKIKAFDEARHDVRGSDDRFSRITPLFELQLTPSDVEQGRLLIPKLKAANYLPSIPDHQPNTHHRIDISDIQKHNWSMTLLYNSSERAFIITRGWHGFVVRHNLEANDVICFCRPFPPRSYRHFLIQLVKKGKPLEFKPENFLFEIKLLYKNIYSWLILPKDEVRNHFPAVEIPAGRELNFIDAHNRDWTMRLFFNEELDAYTIIDGWKEFVKKHRLKVSDVIRFYKPVEALHEGQFLIQLVKRDDAVAVARSSQTQQSGGAGGDGNGDRGGSSKNDKHGRWAKGKKICCWSWINQRGGRDSAMMALEEFLRVTDSGGEEMAIAPN